jgi:hypothetical protein
MTMKTSAALPQNQRIRVPEETVLQIYLRNAHGNKMLMNLPGPLEISMVPIAKQP